jgi:hypothetical protein
MKESEAMEKPTENQVNRDLSEPDRVPVKPNDAVSGEFLTESLEYDGGRQVTVYYPPATPEAIVFAGDGQRIARWGRLLGSAKVPPTMIVGVHGLVDETLRLHEYSLGFEPERFGAHEKFFVDDVRQWTKSRFGLELPEITAALVPSLYSTMQTFGFRPSWKCPCFRSKFFRTASSRLLAQGVRSTHFHVSGPRMDCTDPTPVSPPLRRSTNA